MNELKTKKYFIFLLIVLLVVNYTLKVSAFESTSASFELHAGDIESVTGSSTSATYRSTQAGGQLATGISSLTVFKVYSGVLYWLQSSFTAVYEQIHYRWRNDDGTEVTATFAVNEDLPHVTFQQNVMKRLRFEISNNTWTRGSAPVFTLEVASTTSCSSGSYSAVPTVSGSAWIMATSTNLTDASATTNVAGGLIDNANIFVAGQVKTLGNTTSAITLNSGSFTELEYGLIATTNAPSGNSYCFRLTNAGATTNFLYTNYAQATISSGLPATGSLDSAVFDTFTTGSALQGPGYNSVMWKGNQNGSLGKVQFQIATSDCVNGATDYPTCTTPAWNFIGGASCNGSGYYDTTGVDAPVEISCSPTNHNNQRYFRYRVRICTASDCTSSGSASPIVNDVVVNWAP